MNISPSLLKHFPQLNDVQKEIISHIDGPLLVIAGPGSGKTFSIVLRALNLLLLGKAQPNQIILCTFTEKAAFEMRDRLTTAARTVGYTDDLSEVRVSTIHSLCNQILTEHRHRTPLGQGYESLDELTQRLFIFEHFDEIIGCEVEGKFLNRWSTRWTAIEGARTYFDKITEELINPGQLCASADSFIQALGVAYVRYEELLLKSNRIDFAHLQKQVHNLLNDPAVVQIVTRDIKYVLVDEYQDTNYVQEQLLLKLVSSHQNICVVGDEDQSLYRFRGATVRNILEFPQRLNNTRIVKLTTNYRSHQNIVEKYDHWMTSNNWTNKHGTSFRFDKTISADLSYEHPNYPSVISIWGRDQRDEANRFADFVFFLKNSGVITDYSQVALLLHSVREEHSGPYTKALEAKGIRTYCPRARAYFEIPVVRDLIACFAVILGWHGEARGNVTGSVLTLANYVDDAIVHLSKHYNPPHPLAKSLQKWHQEIDQLREGQTLDYRLADYFYQLLALEPFKSVIHNENIAQNLAIFTQLLGTFHAYYNFTVITHRNREYIRRNFFNSFLRLLHDGGINEYEDPDQPFPKDHVQIMTIHQAKGLEFPVVIVGSLSQQISSTKQIDRDLSSFYHRPLFEPENRITSFDRMRLHYVAFSRPQKILVLTAHEIPKSHFNSIWQGLPQWPYVEKDLIAAQRFDLHERIPIKKSYSFTGDLKVYETCPRQYQFFRKYDFTPSRSATIFFGLLVHQTIEEVHRVALDGAIDTINDADITNMFERTFRFLTLSDVRAINADSKQAALTQVLNYVHQNREDMRRVVQTEVDVSLEKDGYILTGKVDLLLGGDGKLELLDFKSSQRPKNDPELIAAYERQLCTYAHILEQRYGRHVDRLMLYWTAEANKDDALMVLPYNPELVEQAGQHFDETVKRIQANEFAVTTPPEVSICKECDLRRLCQSEHIIPLSV